MNTRLEDEEVCQYMVDLARFPLMEDGSNDMTNSTTKVDFNRGDKDDMVFRFIRTFADIDMREEYKNMLSTFEQPSCLPNCHCQN